MSVSISEILAGASVQAVPLVGECAGYLVLAAADQAVMAPRRIGPAEVHLEGDGSVRVDGARAADEAESEADLRALLDALLVNASSATPALLRASRRPPGRGIAALVREIETALIPVNRSAAHRALARLERETERARQRGRLDAVPVPPSRSEPVRAAAPIAALTPPPVVASPVPPPVVAVERPVVASPMPPAVTSVERPIVEEAQEIPSLFAPPVEPIAANPVEIETRPEPIAVRRSAPPPLPSRTPSPVAPVVEHRSSPPPLPSRTPSPVAPVAEAQRATPFFGTFVQDSSDDDMDIEIDVDDEELIDEELTGVLVRSAPLEVTAMTETAMTETAMTETAMTETAMTETAMTETAASREPTDPCPPVLEDEASDTERSAAPGVLEISEDEISGPEGTILLAPVAERPAPEVSPQDAEVSLPEPSDPQEPEILVLEGTVILPPPAEIPPPAPPPAPEEVALAGADESSEQHGETLALALALGVEPVLAELPPIVRLPMPKPRPSDVNDLLDQMGQSDVDGSDDLRTSLKGMAGIEPTPAPPEI